MVTLDSHHPKKNPDATIKIQQAVTLHSWCHHKASQKDCLDSYVSAAERWTDYLIKCSSPDWMGL